jgi:Phosphatidylglycerophosphate synthase
MKTIFQGKILTIPNILTFARLLMIPWFMWMFLARNDSVGTALILLLSGLTDTIDGAIARRFNMVSNLGKALDPVADKLTQITMMACLVWRFPHMWIVLGALCVKELFMLVSSLMAIHRTEEVLSSAWHGKMTTAALYAAMIAHLLFPDMPGLVSDGLICLCTVMILLSGVLYGIRNVRAIRSVKGEGSHE